MSLRYFLALLSALALGLTFVTTVLTSRYLIAYAALLLPSGEPVSSAEAVGTFLIYQGAIFFITGLVLTLIVFAIFSRLVARPVRSVMKAMECFAQGLPRTQVVVSRFSPLEVRSLVQAFELFAAAVEESHTKDTEISRVKSDFISTAAHQFRTPLTGIRWALEALQNEPLTDEQKSLVQNAVDKSHDLVAVVGTLLDISSIESGKYAYTFAPLKLQDLLEEVAKDFAPLAAQTGVSLYFEKEETSQIPEVRADRDRIKWILNNLIENALRYTPQGGTVRLQMAAERGSVQVLVRDTGIGIASQDRNNIFERFYRAGNAIAKENKGNGLGLYIARTIATDHKGDLTFKANDQGPGTTFTLTLPIASS